MARYTWRMPPLTPAERDSCESMMERHQYTVVFHQDQPLAIYGAQPQAEPPFSLFQGEFSKSWYAYDSEHPEIGCGTGETPEAAMSEFRSRYYK